MWTGENDLNTVTCGRGTFRNRENIYPVLNLHGYVWTGPERCFKGVKGRKMSIKANTKAIHLGLRYSSLHSLN